MFLFLFVFWLKHNTRKNSNVTALLSAAILMTPLFSPEKITLQPPWTLQYSTIHKSCVNTGSWIQKALAAPVSCVWILQDRKQKLTGLKQQQSSCITENIQGTNKIITRSHLSCRQLLCVIWLLRKCLHNCASDALDPSPGPWLVLNQDYLLFKSQPTSPASWPRNSLRRTHLALNQYQNSGERNKLSRGSWNRPESVIVLDIHQSSYSWVIDPKPWTMASHRTWTTSDHIGGKWWQFTHW